MKKYLILLLVLMISQESFSESIKFQEKKRNEHILSKYLSKDKNTVFIFWKSCCPNNLAMLTHLQEFITDDIQSEDIAFVLVALDDSRSLSRAKSVLRTYEWEQKVIFDNNQEISRFLNAIIPPQWVVLDPNGKIIFRCKITNAMNDVEFYLEEILELNNKLN